MAELDEPSQDDYQALIELNTRIGMRTNIPAIVTSVGVTATKRPIVTVQLSPKLVLRDDSAQDIVEIERVPVGYMTGGGITIRMALDIGDGVWCSVSDRTLNGYLEGGGRTYRPGNAGATHDPNDILAIPMINPNSQEPTVNLNPRELYIGDYDGNVTFMRMNVVAGTITMETTTQIDIKCTGPANIDSPVVTIGSGVIQAPIARVGTDFVVVPGGGAGGSFPIISGPIPGGPPSAHTVKG